MRDVTLTESGLVWREIEDLADAAEAGRLSAMPGVEFHYEIDRRRGSQNRYFLLASPDGGEGHVVARQDGPVLGRGLAEPGPDHAGDIESLIAATGLRFPFPTREPRAEGDASAPRGP